MISVRERTEQLEREILSPSAALSAESVGRKRAEPPCDLRTDFQRDRDRIIHCKAFRRLKHKTQVFLSPESDHYRTRLTHTLEVAQIARTVSRALRLNEDLTEAIALGHDLGHTPFGHAGERALNELCGGGFTHFEQSVRVCERLERNGEGLNLTDEVLDGILHHTRGEWAHTLEGRVVRVCDRVAYINHDIDDAVRGGIITAEQLPEEITKHLGYTKSERISSLVHSIIENSGNDIAMDPQTEKYYDMLHKFLFSEVYLNPAAKSEEEKVFGIAEGLFRYFSAHPEKMSSEYAEICRSESVERAVTDYIAGMTDHYAIAAYSDIYIPKSWNL